MDIWIPARHNDARLQASLDDLDSGADAPRIEFYNGVRPAGGGDATTLVATMALGNPPGSLTGNQIVLTVPRSTFVLADATVTWCRFFNGAAQVWMDADVTDLAGPGPVRLEATEVYAGGVLRLTSAVFG